MASAVRSSSFPRDDRVFRVTHVLAVIIVPVLAVAFIMLFLFPQDSDKLFAWAIRPTMSAMMLGGTYLGGAYFFARVVRARQWHTIKDGILPVSSFAGYLGIATVLHWDRFNQGHPSFILWVILYFTLPFVLAAVWFFNRRTDPSTPEPGDPTLSTPVRGFLAVNGVALVVISLLLLVVPQVMIPTWPWTLSPLTARVLAAMFVLPGFVSLNAARERRWSCMRFIFQAQLIALVFILGAIFFSRSDFDWTQPVSWTFVAGLTLTAIALTLIYIFAERRAY